MKNKMKYTDMARRFGRGHLPARVWTDKDIKALADLLRTTRVKGYADGFKAGHEFAEVQRRNR